MKNDAFDENDAKSTLKMRRSLPLTQPFQQDIRAHSQ